MKIVYQNSFDKHTDVFVGEIESFEPSYLDQYQFQLEEGKGGIQQQAQRFFVRQLLADQLGISPAEILKNGKIPYIQDFDRYFSLSHSGNKVAVVIGDNRVGVDIEVETEKILRIKHKFVNDKEAGFINEADIQAGAAIVWGAKESMFKLYQKGALSYLNHLQLEAFKNFNTDHFDCSINKDGLILCAGHHDKVDDYRLVCVWKI